jgi:hypothetical protein
MYTVTHPGIALDLYKLEQQNRLAHLERRRIALDREGPETTSRPRVQAVRRATLALAGAGLALAAAVIFIF